MRNHVTTARSARLAALVHKAAAGALLLGLSYSVDALASLASLHSGLRNSITETVDGGALNRVTAYDYDANKRLIREEITRAGQTGTQVTSWVYDDVGNRVSQTVDGVALSYTYDANDRLLTESDGTSYAYDNNGNLVRTEKGSATQRYSWDSSGRLSEHTDTTGIRTAYSYDPDRVRVSRTTRLGEADAQRTAYLIDYLQPYAQVLEEAAGPATSSALSHQVAYVHGDDLIAQVRGGVVQHYHYDALGSTRLLSGASGAVSDRYAYTAYGELDTSGSLIASENAYRYTGEQFDPALGMYYLRARYMDPGRGRFVGMDPFAGYVTDPMSRHRYQYGHANPVMFVDPSGRVTLSELAITSVRYANIGAFAFLGTGYFNSRSHYYELSTEICELNLNCTEDLIFQLLRMFPVPRLTWPDRRVRTGDYSFAWPAGWVDHVVDESARSIKNITRPLEHFLYYGEVRRSVVSDGQAISVRTVGTGVGIHARLNEMLAPPAWKWTDKHIQESCMCF